MLQFLETYEMHIVNSLCIRMNGSFPIGYLELFLEVTSLHDLVFALIYRKPNNDVVTFVFKYGQVPVQQLQETQSAHILVIKKKRYLAALIIHVLKERKSSGMIRMKSYPTFN